MVLVYIKEMIVKLSTLMSCKLTNVIDGQVRTLLALVVYASAFVYIIKLVTDYKANSSGTFQSGFAIGNDNLKAGNRLNK